MRTIPLVVAAFLSMLPLPLLAQSDTQFLSTATPTGFEFVKDARGVVTHMLIHAEAGDRRAVRKGTR